ncbi:hypothetical protein HYU45_02845 [Candidatus Daviesbacteria bacterium]|nr:hypothetical protein [Candidatus Daviesbacteria bacterium]
MNKLTQLLTLHRRTTLLVVVLVIVGLLSWFGVQSFLAGNQGPAEEIDLIFDAEGPYALLFPRRDGNALILDLKRTSSYDSISYELAYTSTPDEKVVSGNKISEDGEGNTSGSIDRGVMGTIDTKDKKGEYEQEILFGSCSKNVCKYDKGVENGTLMLRIRKGDKVYRMVTQWHLQKPDVALGNLTSGDGHLVYKVDGDRQALANIGFTITNDLTGLPKLPSGKQVLGKVYSLNVPIAKELTGGSVSLELAEDPSEGAKLFRYNGNKSEWQELDTKVEGSKLSAKADGAGIFVVLIPSK